MALVDDPKAYILRMFQMEANEGRSAYCQVFPKGHQSSDLPLEPNEMVYGIYKNKYIFTPDSLIIINRESKQRLRWASITSCSTQHGCGEKQSELTVSGNNTVVIELHELAKGWSGRISQLMHGMIKRWGNQAALGSSLLTIEDFTQRTQDKYEFLPNLEPRPSLDEVKFLLNQLHIAKGVVAVYLSPANSANNDFAITSIIIVSEGRPKAIDRFAHILNASDVIKADTNTKHKVPTTAPNTSVWEVIWA